MTRSESSTVPPQHRLMLFVRREFETEDDNCRIQKLLGDASSRQYFRLSERSGRSYILAAYPEPFDRHHFSYLQICGLLEEIGVPVPRVLAVDGDLGVVLQEDLGDVSLQQALLTLSSGRRLARLREAIELILLIQREGGSRLNPDWEASQLAFDRDKLLWEFHFFTRHFLGNYLKRPATAAEPLEAEFVEIAEELAAAPRVLCHRDFHIRNLMIHDGRLHLLDFQDARWGPPSYDLASLLKDSIELDTEEVESLVDYYLVRSKLNQAPPSFRHQFHVMVVQRMLKALGTYGYQIAVREHFIYEQYIAGTLRRALLSLAQLARFPQIQRLVEREIGFNEV